MKLVLVLLALAALMVPAGAWTDEQMLYFSEIAYKTGYLSSLAEDTRIMYSNNLVNFTTYKTIVDGANFNIRLYNLLLDSMFNSSISLSKKLSEYSI